MKKHVTSVTKLILVCCILLSASICTFSCQHGLKEEIFFQDGDYELYYVSACNYDQMYNNYEIVDYRSPLPAPKQDGYIITHYSGDSVDLVLPERAFDGKPIIGIGRWAFVRAINLETIVIPDSYQYIHDNSFVDLKKLRSVTLGKNLNYIAGGTVFHGCTNIMEICVDARNDTYITIENCLFERETMCLLVGSTGVSSIPTVTTEIGVEAFHSRIRNSNIHIPQNVTKIDLSAFATCSDSNFYIGKNVQIMEDCVFDQASNVNIYCSFDERPTSWSECWMNGDQDKPSSTTVIWGHKIKPLG